MQRALEELGPHLRRLSDGETGSRQFWVMPILETFRAHPDAEITRDGDNTSYEDTALFKVRDGHELRPESINLGYHAAFRRSHPQFLVLRERYGRPDLPFQVGIPNPVDLAGYGFGEEGFRDAGLIGAFVAATLNEIGAILAEVDTSDVVFQLENVAALVAVAQTPLEARAAVAEQLASQITALIAASPEGTRWGMHLCMGDFNHEAYMEIPDVSPWVQLANAITVAWPEGRTLDYIHAPFAAAAKPPPEEQAFYTAVEELRLPAGTRFVAGFIHEDLDHEHHRQLLDRIESLYGGEVDVATACGLGRRPDQQQAWDAMAEARRLIESST